MEKREKERKVSKGVGGRVRGWLVFSVDGGEGKEENEGEGSGLTFLFDELMLDDLKDKMKKVNNK